MEKYTRFLIILFVFILQNLLSICQQTYSIDSSLSANPSQSQSSDTMWLEMNAPGQIYKKCELLKTDLHLNTSRFAGKWYKVASYPLKSFENEKCGHLHAHALNEDLLLIKAFLFSPVLLLNSTIKALASITRQEYYEPIELQVIEPANFNLKNWRILHVDYKRFAIMNGCSYQNGSYAGHLVWVLSRSKKPSESEWESSLEALRTFKINPTPLEFDSQNNCKHDI